MARESAFGKEVMQRHGARKDLRLFRNTVGSYWTGRFKSLSPGGVLTLYNASKVHGGLPDGSADYIGIQGGTGKLISLELKAPGASTDKERKILQAAWRDMIVAMGGIAGECSTLEQVDALLGLP